jgi:hypothetical protein
MVVDSDVDEFPAFALAAAIARAATSVDAVAIAVEAAQAGFGLAMKGGWRGVTNPSRLAR